MEEQIKKFLKSLRVNESLISTLLGVVVIVVVGGLLYSYFSKKPTIAPEEVQLNLSDDKELGVKPGEVNEGETPTGLPTTHVVKDSETLWSIAEHYYGSGYNFADVVAENKLKNADDIKVGTELSIPNVSAKKQTIQAVGSNPSPAPESSQAEAAEVTEAVKVAEAITGDHYATTASDTLWLVAVRAYGDGYQWPKIYAANKQKIGRNSNRLWEGIELVIPR